MPLEPTNFPAHEVIGGMQFSMNDGEKIVSVLVTHEALENIESFEASGPKLKSSQVRNTILDRRISAVQFVLRQTIL
jgi:hypothetical protein